MPKTLLAVDDSATMRKVLEITFSGEDFTVVTAESSQTALAKLGDRPSAVVIDTALGSDDGYALAREIRKKEPAAAIVLLASRYAPYDAARGKEAGADDFMDKPFDTQQMIDKLRKVMLSKEGGVQAPPAAQKIAAAPAVPATAAAAAHPPAATAAKPARSQTLVFGEGGAAGAPPPAARAAESPRVQAASTTSPGTAAQASASQSGASSAVSSSVNGQFAGKLSELGLTAAQADAVMALSREVVERVVWEVVPPLAEALIKEEIARLTRA